jgi:hypothetical protein
MGRPASPKAPALDHPQKSSPFGSTGHIDPIPYAEGFHGNVLAYLKGAGIVNPELFKVPESRHLGSGEVSLEGLFQPLGVSLLKTQLDGGIFVLFRCLDEDDLAGARLDYRDRNDSTFLMKNLGHPQFFPDNSLQHD